MDKIKIALTSGSTIEKPLVSAFKTNASAYVVLDNEVNGTMGLPIILVSKYSDNRLVKIGDQNEWNAVKEALRNIIAGNQIDYIKVPLELIADDGFFSQLTLPIASFESLKANYKPTEEDSNPTVPSVTPETPTTPVSPAMPEASVMNQFGATPTAPEMPMPPVTPVMQAAPIAPEVPSTPVTPTINVTPTPEVAPTMEAPTAPIMPEAPAPMPEAVSVSPAPVVEPIPESSVVESQTIDFSVEKEAFMKACENMFDALVAKFNK